MDGIVSARCLNSLKGKPSMVLPNRTVIKVDGYVNDLDYLRKINMVTQ